MSQSRKFEGKDCGEVFAEDLNKFIRVVPKEGETCEEAKKRVKSDHETSKSRDDDSAQGKLNWPVD
jgi:hypothetical protein